jgi:hypothetical protein
MPSVTVSKVGGRTLLWLALLVAALVSPIERSARAQGKSPRVVYVVNADDWTDKIVLAIQNCCNEDVRAVKTQGPGVCPPGPALPCEFLRVDRGKTGFRVYNDFPADKLHKKMMAAAIEYESQDPKNKDDEFWYNLKQMITCHDYRWHEDSAHTSGVDVCDRCGPKEQAPKARATGQ